MPINYYGNMALTTSQIAILKREIPVWIDTLYSNGFSTKQISFTIPQMLLESGYFTSNSYRQDLNPLGIKFRPANPSPDTTQGRKSSEFNTDGSYYARFGSKDSLAKEYKRILSLKRVANKLGKPIDAVDLRDFSKRLKANGYHQIAEPEYYRSLVGANKNISIAVPNYLDMLKKKNIASYLFYSGLILLGLVWIIKKNK
jgi:hypothetical protein